MAKLKNNWFYFALLIFAVALPFSEGLISTSIGLLLITAIIQYKKREFRSNYMNRKEVLTFTGIFLVYVVWLVFTNDWKWAAYDLQKNISYLIIPFSFFLAPTISYKQQSRVLQLFAVSVVISALITIVYFYMQKEHSVLDAQEYGFIHHIRFSFELIFAIVILLSIILLTKKKKAAYLNLAIISACIFLFVFLIWHQSLTGIITFLGTSFIGTVLLVSKIKNNLIKSSVYIFLFLLILIPAGYIKYSVNKFYDIDDIQPEKLEEYTQDGNKYFHDLNNQEIENGHFVWLYVCEKELEEEWNKRGNLMYDELDENKYQVKYTLIRYLTSKNLRKDAEGVRGLTNDDIQNIESGVSNYILANRTLSLYPRIYVSIWEVDTYLKSGNANHRSLAQRIEYTKAALTIIKKNFWFGVGTGNWKKAYAEAYRQNKSQMDPARFGDAHNQYLNYTVKFGLVGLLLILFLIFYPVIKSKAYNNPVFLLFLVIMFLGNLGDSNFETHVGSNLFVFFYCLLLLPKAKELVE